jgi:hypothetical protein
MAQYGTYATGEALENVRQLLLTLALRCRRFRLLPLLLRDSSLQRLGRRA